MAFDVQGFQQPNYQVNPVAGNKYAPQDGMTQLGSLLDYQTKNLALQKQQALQQPEIEEGIAKSQSAKANSSIDQIKAVRNHFSSIVSQGSDLLQDEELTPEKIINRYEQINKGLPNGEDPKALNQVLSAMPQKAKGESEQAYQARLKSYVAVNMSKGLENLAQFEKTLPATAQTDVGGQIVSTGTGNPLVAAVQPGVPTGPYLQKNLAPQVAVSPTGGPMQFGGGGVPQAGNLNNRPAAVQVGPAGGGANVTNIQQGGNQPSANKPTGVSASAMLQPKTASGPIPYMQGETYDAYRERVGKVQKSINQANEDLKTSNPTSVTNARYTNDEILKALDNKNVRVGPLMQAISDKSEGLNLTPEEQYVKKLLEQRIQQQQSRSNADQNSKSIASGNFGNSKDAIRNVIFKDNGTLTAHELQARGTLNKAGNINKPNLAGVNDFQNEFAKHADPEVTHLMGVIGNKPLNELTKSEIAHLQKEFSGMSKEKFNALMEKRQKLIDLSGK